MRLLGGNDLITGIDTQNIVGAMTQYAPADVFKYQTMTASLRALSGKVDFVRNVGKSYGIQEETRVQLASDFEQPISAEPPYYLSSDRLDGGAH